MLRKIINNGGKMRISKEVMSGSLEIFDKHFPNEKNTPMRKKIVKFF